jgi:hypothetical protein
MSTAHRWSALSSVMLQGYNGVEGTPSGRGDIGAMVGRILLALIERAAIQGGQSESFDNGMGGNRFSDGCQFDLKCFSLLGCGRISRAD